MEAKEKAIELYDKFIGTQGKLHIQLKLTGFTQVKRDAKKYSLIAVDENIKLIKNILNQSTQIHQSLSTPKKLCIDVLNPILKELEEVKQEIQKL